MPHLSNLSPAERIRIYCEPVDDGCWAWRGTADRHGYGEIRIAGKVRFAHRVSYEAFVGPIPDGLTIDHLCRNPGCVNPLHLEPVTRAENTRRGWKVRKPITHCRRGHELTPENVARPGDGRRRCRTCLALRPGRQAPRRR